MRRCIYLLLLLLMACSGSDEEEKKSYFITIISPGPGEHLGCLDDLDLSTETVLEQEIEVLALPVDPGLSLQLSLDSASTTRVLPLKSNGRLIFSDFPLPRGRPSIQVALLNREGEVLSQARHKVFVNLDPEIPCVQEETHISILSPRAERIFTLSDVENGELDRGLYTDVEILAQGPMDGPVQLLLNGVEAGSAEPPPSGRLRFSRVRLPITADLVSLNVQVPAPGRVASAQIDIFIDIQGCDLSLEPPHNAGEGCDYTSKDDVNPEQAGLQILMAAQSNCSNVIFEVNAVPQPPQPLFEGRAEMEVTVSDGENSVRASSSTEEGLSGISKTIRFSAQSIAPALELELDPENLNILNEAALEEGSSSWVLRGEAQGFPSGTNITPIFLPDLNERQPSVKVSEDGSFQLRIDTEIWCGTFKMRAVDPCEILFESEPYPICFDHFRPRIEILSPSSGAALTHEMDIDPERLGTQIEFRISVEDRRPSEIDYEIFLFCGFRGEELRNRSDQGISRRDLTRLPGGLAQGNLRITLLPLDAGDLECELRFSSDSNSPETQSVPYFYVAENPSFYLSSPQEGECFQEEVHFGGLGEHLEENHAQLSVVISPSDQADLEPVNLQRVGEGAFELIFGGPRGVPALPDGRYSARIEGEIIGGLPVEISPTQVSFLVDTTAPVLRLEAPSTRGTLGLESDYNQDLSDCVQTGLTLELADTTTREICYNVNGFSGQCRELEEIGFLHTERFTLLKGENNIFIWAEDCAGNIKNLSAVISTSDDCPPKIEIISPTEGQRFSQSDDEDQEQDGIQISVEMHTLLPPRTPLEVLLLDEGGEERIFDGGDVNPLGRSSLQITLPVIEGEFWIWARSGESEVEVPQAEGESEIEVPRIEGPRQALSVRSE